MREGILELLYTRDKIIALNINVTIEKIERKYSLFFIIKKINKALYDTYKCSGVILSNT